MDENKAAHVRQALGELTLNGTSRHAGDTVTLTGEPNATLNTDDLRHLTSLSDRWSVDVEVKRSGAGLTVKVIDKP
jgi:hypothetical protein